MSKTLLHMSIAPGTPISFEINEEPYTLLVDREQHDRLSVVLEGPGEETAEEGTEDGDKADASA